MSMIRLKSSKGMCLKEFVTCCIKVKLIPLVMTLTVQNKCISRTLNGLCESTHQMVHSSLSLSLSLSIYLSIHTHTHTHTLINCALSSSYDKIFRLSMFKTKHTGQRYFCLQGPCTWNKFPHNVRHSSTSSSSC